MSVTPGVVPVPADPTWWTGAASVSGPHGNASRQPSTSWSASTASRDFSTLKVSTNLRVRIKGVKGVKGNTLRGLFQYRIVLGVDYKFYVRCSCVLMEILARRGPQSALQNHSSLV